VILADTSAWVEFDRATGSPIDVRMTDLVAAADAGAAAELAVTEPVLMEVLAGARSEARADDLRRLLARGTLLRLEPVTDFEAAARIYRSYRRAGVTPRDLLDCLIAAVALRCGAVLLAHDADLQRVAAVMGIGSDAPQKPVGSRSG
jgi:predicted nucleic acid-binding protein